MSVGDVIVSVVMPAYNAAAFLGNAIASLQVQTLDAWEAIVIDDASTDETLEIAESLAAADRRIRVLKLDRNGGPSAARNAGFAVARGEWVALLDADDVYLPERLETMVSAARRLDSDILSDNQWLKDPAHGGVVRSGFPRSGGPRRFDLETLYLKSLSASGFDYGTLKPIFRSAFLKRVNVPYRSYRYGEDFVFLGELLALGARAWLIPQPFYVYTLTVSELDGRKAATSRTVTDYDQLLKASNSIEDRYAARLSAREKAAIRKRAFFIEEYRSAMIFKDQRREKNYLEMFKTLIRHPFIAVMIFRGVKWRLRAMLPDQRFAPS